MKIAIDILRQFIELPESERELRDLFDDLGLEVKRAHATPGGLVFTLELLANRGDHHGYHGIAREISGRTGSKLTLPPISHLITQEQSHLLPIRIETPLCLVYTATVLTKEEESEFPKATEALLSAAGLRPLSPPVDATNVANLEFGQPTHTFDADKIVGSLVVRTSKPDERAWLLFQAEPIVIPTATLVIADDEKILAIAGVIGCEESKTTETTRRIVLESATFDPVAVRKASRALGIHTDSSARFERGGDPAAPLIGAGRVVYLLEKAGWKRTQPTLMISQWQDPQRTIPFEIGAAAGFLEYPLTEEEIRERLSRYGFDVSPRYPDFTGDPQWRIPAGFLDRHRDRLRNTVLVRVPPHRLWDVEYSADIVEELARSIGYNATPNRLPPIDLGSLPSAAEVARTTIDQLLVSSGFHEVFTDGFYGRDLRDRLGISESHPLWNHVETCNAVDRAYSLLKNNCFAQAVEAVAENLRLQTKMIRMFEWTRTFHPDKNSENGVCSEHKTLWAIASGPAQPLHWSNHSGDIDIYLFKGLITAIGAVLRLDLSINAAKSHHPLAQLLHPHRQAGIFAAGKQIGIFGEVHPSVTSNFKIKRERPIYLEIDAAALLNGSKLSNRYIDPSSIQPVERSLAFTLPGRVTADSIAECLRTAGLHSLKRVAIVDRYDHEENGAMVRTITYRLIFQPDQAAFTSEELNQACESLIHAVLIQFGETGVKLRA